MLLRLAFIASLTLLPLTASGEGRFAEARANARRFDNVLDSMHRLLRAWLTHADAKTLLLPERVPGGLRGLQPGETARIYTPENSGADLYPYLVLTAHLSDPELYRGLMLQMLRNEVLHTTVRGSIPARLDLASGQLGPYSLFGAGEYAKDGLTPITEYLGRTPWFYRMAGMVADAMERAAVKTRFGPLPGPDAELNGDYMQALMRLSVMTGDQRFREWGRRIAEAYIEEVLPKNHGLPSSKWDFDTHQGDHLLRLRDHGNEAVVGLVLQYVIESRENSHYARRWRPAIERMLDRILASANPDGMLYNEVEAETLRPTHRQSAVWKGDGLADTWGYVYGAMYAYYQATGEARFRDAVRHVLRNLGKYRRYLWEGRPGNPLMPDGSFDGYADSIEGAIYLVNREPVPEALAWIESEMQIMLRMQKPDGHVEYWYGEGNYNRTAMLYALMKSQGVRPERWAPGVGVGAVRDGERLLLSLMMPSPRTIRFDSARHRRILNLDRNYVRLNEFPEWYPVEENRIYVLRRPAEPRSVLTFLGAELIEGVSLAPGDWIVEPKAGPPDRSHTQPDKR